MATGRLHGVIECVVNVSEGQDRSVIEAVAASARDDLLDVHTDPHHHRTVVTLFGEEAPRRVAAETVRLVDLRHHRGVHPRIGAVDVVPFVPLGDTTIEDAIAARDRFCTWAADTLDLPCFTYGPERTLPEVRRGAFTTLSPRTGPDRPHPTAGAAAVGARGVLVAYNVWLGPDAHLGLAKDIAAGLRSPTVRALGLQVGERVQVSMNLISPEVTGPATVVAQISARAQVAGCELVGLVPAAVLDAVPEGRWEALDLGVDQTIEARLEHRRGR